MTQSNLLELAQQGDPQAIAALMNQSLQPRGMTATVERAGDSLNVLLEGEEVPNRQTLTAFVERGISNLGIPTIRSIKVLGQKAGTHLPAWTRDLMLEPPPESVDEAIAALDLSTPAATDESALADNLDFSVDFPETDSPGSGFPGSEASYFNGHPPEDDMSPDELELDFAAFSEGVQSEDAPVDAIDSLWVAPSEGQAEDSLADLLADTPELPDTSMEGLMDSSSAAPSGTVDDLQGFFGAEEPEPFSTSAANLPEENPLEDLSGMFGESSMDFSDGLTSDDFISGEFTGGSLPEESLPEEGLLGDSPEDNDLQSLFGEEESASPGNFVPDNFADNNFAGSLADDLFAEQTDEEDEELQGMFEETPPNAEEFQDLFGESQFGESQPSASQLGETQLGETQLDETVDEDESSEQLLSFLGEEFQPVSYELDLEEESTSEDQLLNFLGEETEDEQVEPVTFDESLSLDEPVTFDESVAFDNDRLSFEDPSFDEPLSLDRDPLSNESVSFDEPSLVQSLLLDDELGNELGNGESFDDPLALDLDQDSSSPEAISPESLSMDAEALDNEPLSFSDLESREAWSSAPNFQEQQALADFFSDDPLADFLEPAPYPEEDFLEGGFSEPMVTATAQEYLPEATSDNFDFLPDDADDSGESTQLQADDLFSAPMDGLDGELSSEFPALETPLPDVDYGQPETISSLENLTEESMLPEQQTEVLFDQQPEAEPDFLHDAQPARWDVENDQLELDSLEPEQLEPEEVQPDQQTAHEPSLLENLWDEPAAMGAAAIGGLGTVGATVGAGALETLGGDRDLSRDLSASQPEDADDHYGEVAYPSLNDPMQSPPQPQGSSPWWLFPLVAFGVAGWVLALILLSYLMSNRDSTPPPNPQPPAGSPAPSIPPPPASPAPSSVLPNASEEVSSAASSMELSDASSEVSQTEAVSDSQQASPDWLAVD